MITTNCATGSLATYVPTPDKPWDEKRVVHLFRRMGVGLSADQIAAALSKTPEQVVDEIIDNSLNASPLPAPIWANWVASDYGDDQDAIAQYVEAHLTAWGQTWMKDMLEHPFRGKMTLFWHNHFVVKFPSFYYCTSYQYQHYKVLEDHWAGNFKTFVEAVGKTPAMLFFLNGIQNTRIEPNENYARELYELFTLGRDNGYTQTDITETARALTGWNGISEYCGPVGFVSLFHDPGFKNIFGQNGQWGYDEVHNMLFDPAIRGQLVAKYIAEKLYKYFVNPVVNEAFVQELADFFIEENFEFDLLRLYRKLFKSEHFFDEANIGVIIKSPVDCVLNMIKQSNLAQDEETILFATYFTYLLGQEIFDPVDVKGWPGNRSWVDSSTLPNRWQTLRLFLFRQYEADQEVFRKLAKDLAKVRPI